MRVQFGKVIRDSAVCVLCGKRPATTREHIPPQALFLEKPLEYLVVPFCEECNSSSKLDDDYLKETMSAIALVGQGRKIWKQKVVPKFRDFPKTQVGLREATFLQKVDIDRFGQMTFPVVGIDAERFQRSIRKMVYGLHWFHTGNLLSPMANLSVNLLDTLQGPKYLQKPEVREVLQQLKMGLYRDPKVMETFFYTGAIYDNISIWVFCFYKQGFAVSIVKEDIQPSVIP